MAGFISDHRVLYLLYKHVVYFDVPSYWDIYIYIHSPVGDENSARYVEPPVIPGHEFVGEVVKLGKGIYIFSRLFYKDLASIEYCSYVLMAMEISLNL